MRAAARLVDHAISGLVAAGVSVSDPAIARAVTYLLGKQRSDGGWGEHGDTCRETLDLMILGT